MSDRVHVLIDEADKERYREIAAREGKSLSVWLREAAEEKYRAAAGARVLTSRGDLESFFDRCDATEVGREPDWAVHRRVIEESIAAGNPPIAAPDRPKRGR